VKLFLHENLGRSFSPSAFRFSVKGGEAGSNRTVLSRSCGFVSFLTRKKKEIMTTSGSGNPRARLRKMIFIIIKLISEKRG
jgi:hypothetical protein